MELYPYQIPHVRNLIAAIKRWGAALDGSDAGTGKTITALAVAQELGLHIFVLCPKVMIPTWERTATEMGVKHGVTNYEKARIHGVKKYKNTIYCCDEVHVCSGLQTQNAKLLINIKQTGCPVLMLSATVAETPMKLWAIGAVLGLHNARLGGAENPFLPNTGMGYYQWLYHHGVRRTPPFNVFTFDNKPANLKKLHGTIFPTRGNRMRKMEIPDFPEVQNTVEVVLPDSNDDLAPFFAPIKQRRLDLLAQLSLEPDQESPLAGIETNPSLCDDLYERMETELYKVLPLLSLAKCAVEEGNNVAVFVNFRGTLEALQLLYPNCVTIYGGQDPKERQRNIDLFQRDQARTLFCTIESGGVGLSLHDLNGQRPRMSLISPPWRAVTLIQALGRIHRTGAKSKAWNRLILVNRSIENRVAARLKKKVSAIETVNNGDLNPDSDLAFLHNTK